MKRLALMLLCLLPLLTACGTERVITQPEVVEVVRVERVTVPGDLLIQHNKTTIQEGPVSFAEAIEYWSLDRAIIDTLNGQIRAIESLNDESE